MEITIENGEIRYVPLSAIDESTKKQISQKIMSHFTEENNPHLQPIETTQVIALPLFCPSCQQAVVEFKDQNCPTCINKLINAKKLKSDQSFWIGVFSTFALFFLVGLIIYVVFFR